VYVLFMCVVGLIKSRTPSGYS